MICLIMTNACIWHNMITFGAVDSLSNLFVLRQKRFVEVKFENWGETKEVKADILYMRL